jgi:hypothetical protein
MMPSVMVKPKTTSFLDSVGRNSLKTTELYSLALKHFQSFLEINYSSKYSIENIVEAILTNQINVYETLNDFVSYLLSIKNDEMDFL